MPFDWSDFLELAEELSKRDDEAALRTAASRAYYYVYHLGRQRIIDNGFQFRKGSTHQQVWDKFATDADVRCQKLNNWAKILHEKRKQADYNVPYPKIEDEFPALLVMAREFATELNGLDRHLPGLGILSSQTASSPE